MRRHIMHRLSAVAVTGGAAILTLGLAGPGAGSAAAARAHSPDPIYTTSQAGFVTGGRWFRYVRTTVKVAPVPSPRGNAGYAEVVLGGPSVVPQYLAVTAGGGPRSIGWSAGVPPFGMGGGVLSGVSPKVGDLLQLSIYYDRAGHVFFTAVDRTQGTGQTLKMPAGSPVYTAAEVAGVVDNAMVTAPKSSIRLWALSGSRATTYTGVHGTLTGPWTTTEIVDTTTGNSAGAVVISPNVLWNGGQNFGVWLRPTA